MALLFPPAAEAACCCDAAPLLLLLLLWTTDCEPCCCSRPGYGGGTSLSGAVRPQVDFCCSCSGFLNVTASGEASPPAGAAAGRGWAGPKNEHNEDSSLDGILSLGSRFLTTQPIHQYIFFYISLKCLWHKYGLSSSSELYCSLWKVS